MKRSKKSNTRPKQSVGSKKTQTINKNNNFIIRISFILFFVIIAALSLLFLYSNKPENIDAKEIKTNIYYLNKTTNKLEPEIINIENGTNREIVERIITKFYESAPKNLNLTKTTINNNPVIDSVNLDDINKIVEITFTDSYKDLTPIEEIYFRASLVWTLTELDFIENIQIFIGQEELLKSDGEAIGLLNRNNVKIQSDDVGIKKEQQKIKLYFADSNAMNLVAEERYVEVSNNISIEQQIVQGLIDGPQNNDNIRTIPAETKILEVKVDEKVCYVNFSADFINKFEGGSTAEELAVYSIVDSLTELSNIQKVQILIESDKRYEIKGNLMDISSPFDRDESLILK